MRVAITGASGYLASLIQIYNGDSFEFVPITRRDVDYLQPESVEAYVRNLDFDLMLHMAANATTADCENDPERTHLVNCDSAIAIARACQHLGRRMVFISTEQLYNGKTVPGPFNEGVEPSCVTAYGQQKLEVDKWLRTNAGNYVTLRLSWMFGLAMPGVHPSPGVLGNVLKALRTKTPTKFTVNEKRCMTYAQRLAEQFGAICELPSGTYHFASSNGAGERDGLSTYEAARLIGEKLVESGIARRKDVEAYILPNPERYADRFRDFRLDASAIQSQGIELGTLESDVERCLSDFGWH
ncbi:sugar nucleotide-binding protein [uncultured Parolsenella sp.]|uniref:SDR family oxidoreductase n=1 Tax=uncultured Parolsenella sp. TaxID=2083008 RepID=UPI0027D97BF5|nr:sugar nucleotide-binding protein [uncultured Parolsenella sp.]